MLEETADSVYFCRKLNDTVYHIRLSGMQLQICKAVGLLGAAGCIIDAGNEPLK
jgi:hypothetical protein